MRKTHAILLVALIIAASLVAYWVSRPVPSTQFPTALQSALWPEPKPLPSFTLTNHLNQPLKRDEFLGHWTFLFFGYTSCPDICPNTLAVLRSIADRLESVQGGANPPQYLFVSVDPQRDTVERLNNYVTYFHPSLVGATGKEEVIAELAKELYILYERAETRSPDDYDINHTASIVLVDPQARLYGKFSPPHKPGEMVELYQRLREHYRQTTR